MWWAGPSAHMHACIYAPPARAPMLVNTSAGMHVCVTVCWCMCLSVGLRVGVRWRSTVKRREARLCVWVYQCIHPYTHTHTLDTPTLCHVPKPGIRGINHIWNKPVASMHAGNPGFEYMAQASGSSVNRKAQCPVRSSESTDELAVSSLDGRMLWFAVICSDLQWFAVSDVSDRGMRVDST